MKQKRITIDFSQCAAPADASATNLMHRVRNLGEALFLEFRGTRNATVENMDEATTALFLKVPSEGKLRKVMPGIQKLLKEHFFEDAVITVHEQE